MAMYETRIVVLGPKDQIYTLLVNHDSDARRATMHLMDAEGREVLRPGDYVLRACPI